MPNSQFHSQATMVADGTVEVEGSLDNNPAAMVSDVEFRFLLVQGDVVVQGRGRGSAGVWNGKTLLGQPALQEGEAQAIGLAFVARREPPGYETFTWTDQVHLVR
jgi:hypothetical protein